MEYLTYRGLTILLSASTIYTRERSSSFDQYLALRVLGLIHWENCFDDFVEYSSVNKGYNKKTDCVNR